MIESIRERNLSQEESSSISFDYRSLSSDIKAATGVSSLMLLIATILISAIVAGVLIDTVTRLQQQSEKTGQEALWEVSSGLKTVSVTGDRKENSDPANPTSSNIQVVEVTTGLQAGSRAIDLDNLLVTIENGNTSVELTHNASGTDASDADDSTFVTETLRDPDGEMSSENVMSQGTLVKIIISVDEDAVDMEMGPSSQVNIKLIPKHGHSTRISLTTPPVYTSRYISLK
ncbi:MAG: hypothetical protein ACOC40_01620 [Thermoplasmatota archaeon]